jgi:hypothetical protein
MILLLTRLALRIPPFLSFRYRLHPIGENVLREYAWLKRIISMTEIEILSSIWFSSQVVDCIISMVKNGISTGRIIKLRRLLEPEIKQYRMYSSMRVFLIFYFRHLILRLKKISI